MARRYKVLTREEIALLWSRWQRGDGRVAISASLGCSSDTVMAQVQRRGGVAPRARHRAERQLTLGEREEISRGLARKESRRSIAARLGRAPSTIGREITRHGGPQAYRAEVAETRAWANAARPKRCRLATQRRLRALVSRQLRRDWSPQQIAAWLLVTYPDEPTLHVSHETIYRTLYVQARGALKRELLAHLRHRQTRRRPRAALVRGSRAGRLLDTVSISERPPSVEARAVPGHWEGDLLMGGRDTQIATLVERHSRFVVLVRVPRQDSASLVTALAARMQQLPRALRRSLTWDRGKEMAQHRQFTIATDVQVYFCDPHSPWQRGSNENTNGLLRQYFPKGADLSRYTQQQLDAVARRLNTRPRQTLGWKTPADYFHAAIASTG